MTEINPAAAHAYGLFVIKHAATVPAVATVDTQLMGSEKNALIGSHAASHAQASNC